MQVAQSVNALFAFCYVWALGGNLRAEAAEDFSSWAREQLAGVASFPGVWVNGRANLAGRCCGDAKRAVQDQSRGGHCSVSSGHAVAQVKEGVSTNWTPLLT
jgi:hypothetical protein